MLKTNPCLFPDSDFNTEFAVDITNYAYSKLILIVP